MQEPEYRPMIDFSKYRVSVPKPMDPTVDMTDDTVRQTFMKSFMEEASFAVALHSEALEGYIAESMKEGVVTVIPAPEEPEEPEEPIDPEDPTDPEDPEEPVVDISDNDPQEETL